MLEFHLIPLYVIFCLFIFFLICFSLLFLLLRLGKPIVLSSSSLILSPELFHFVKPIYEFLLAIPLGFFFSYKIFIWFFFIFLLFAEVSNIFLSSNFFFCFKHACNCSLKSFNDVYVKIIVR